MCAKLSHAIEYIISLLDEAATETQVLDDARFADSKDCVVPLVHTRMHPQIVTRQSRGLPFI